MGGCCCFCFYSCSVIVAVASFSCPRPSTLAPSHERTRQRGIRGRQWEGKKREVGRRSGPSLELRQQYDSDEMLQQQVFGVGSSSDSFAADYYDTVSSSSYSSVSTFVSSPMDIAIESYLDYQSADNMIIPISIANNELLDNNSIHVSISVAASSKDESTTTTVSTSRTSNQVKNNIALSDAAASADVSSVIKVTKKRMTNNDTSLTIIDDNTKEARFEKDLQLTRHVILRHIDQVSVDDYIDDDNDDDDDDDDKLQYNNNNNNNNNINADVAVTSPTISRILQYTLPAIGIWLCSPVLSMIDTAAVGLLAGTAQQAALNPAIAVSDYGAIVVAFMYTATTNLVAAAVREDKDDDAAAAAAAATKQNEQVILQKRPKTTATVLTAIKLASIVGTLFSILLYTLHPRLLQLLIGTTAATATTSTTTATTIIDPIVYNSALKYVKIRALGMPAMVMIGTAQSACLGMQDVHSPLFVLLAAAVVNFIGDVLLVPLKSSTLGGAAGAAWATVASQYAALLFFARWWLIKPRDDNTATAATTTTTTTTTTSTRGVFSDSKLTLRSFLSLKNINTSKVQEFLPFVIPVTTTSISRISGYIAMSHVASSTLGTIDLAGHQIILSIFGCITPFVDALSQVAQSLVPDIFASNGHGQQQHSNGRKKERAIALRQTVMNFRIVGLSAGAILVGLISCVPFVSQYFTTNKAVLERVHGAIKPVSLFLIVNGLMCAGEGTLLGQKDLKFLRNMYTIFFFTVPAYMLRLKYRALLGLQIVGIETMWTAFAIYNVVRATSFQLRLSQLSRRTDRSVDVVLLNEEDNNDRANIV